MIRSLNVERPLLVASSEKSQAIVRADSGAGLTARRCALRFTNSNVDSLMLAQLASHLRLEIEGLARKCCDEDSDSELVDCSCWTGFTR